MSIAQMKVTGLTNRECDVALVVGSGLNLNEAALKLEISRFTIKFHLNNIYRKIGIEGPGIKLGKLILWVNSLEKEPVASEDANVNI